VPHLLARSTLYSTSKLVLPHGCVEGGRGVRRGKKKEERRMKVFENEILHLRGTGELGVNKNVDR